MFDVLKRITELRDARNWTEYRLSTEAEMSQSTISTWYKKNMIPSLASLEKICKAFHITLSQFFAEGEEGFPLTQEQKELLEHWSSLDDQRKKALLTLMK